MTEPIAINKALSGRYRDRLFNPQGYLLWQSSWCSNRILHNCDRLLAALLKGEVGMQGLLYWAVGEGQPSWDALLPNPEPTNTRLTQEVVRLPLAPGQINYIDAQDNSSTTPTQRLEILLDLDGSTLVESGFQSLREFGLFGGNATLTPNSGFMINQVIHPRIDVAPGMILSRTLQLTFTLSDETAVGSLTFTGPRAALPVTAIDGVGIEYTSDFASAGVTNVAAVAQLDPRRAIGRIPEGKLREFRAKARLVLSQPTDLGELVPLASTTVADFLRTPAAALLAGEQVSGVSQQAIVQWQAQLENVHMALDETHLQQISLGELISA